MFLLTFLLYFWNRTVFTILLMSLSLRMRTLVLWIRVLLLWPHLTVMTPLKGFPGGTSGKGPTCQCIKFRRHGFNPWSGSSPGRGHILAQCSCLENPVDRGAWLAVAHRVTKSQTWLKQLRTLLCISLKALWPVIITPWVRASTYEIWSGRNSFVPKQLF